MMLLQRRPVQLFLASTVLLCLLAGVCLSAYRRFSKSNRSGKVIKHSVDTPSDEVLKYWTADKMRNTKATNMPIVDNLEQGKQHPPRA